MRLTPGTRVGPYEVVALLGVGGMAEVYRAKDTRLGREVAIKVVSEALGAIGPLLERFEREAKLAGALNHPNVVALYDVGLQDGQPYFVTELLEGETLRKQLTKGPIPLTTALEWAAQMARGLAAAHESGIVHRDLKPENVFVTRDGPVKLLDFGIAKLVESVQGVGPHSLMDETLSPSGEHTRTGAVVGTPGYMSPEQVRGDAVDARSDFFSLGAVLYEMLCGRRAFPGGPVVESGFAILHNEAEPLPLSIPPQVAQVVQRCLEKDTDRRFQSARDLAFNLELLRSPTGSTAPSATGWGVATRASEWRRWLWPLAASLAALGATAATTYFMGRASRPPMPSVEQVTAELGRISAARFDPDGRLVYSAAWKGRPVEIFSQAPLSPEAHALRLRDMYLFGVSRTGELAVGLRNGNLALVSGAGAAREVAENVIDADWGPKGELAAVRAVGTGYRLEYPLGTAVFEATQAIRNPRVSPRGDSVAFLLANRSGFDWMDVMLVDQHGRARKLSTTDCPWCGLAWVPSGDEVWFDREGSIWASPLSGGRRLVYQGVTEMVIQDISRDGHVLVNAQDTRNELAFVASEQNDQRSLTWFDKDLLVALSDDGRHVLFTAFPDEPSVYIGPTDGSPPLKLGPGLACDLSPDGKWALAAFIDRDGLSLLPVGAGTPRTVPFPGLKVIFARWMHDGKRILVKAQVQDDKDIRLYIVPIEGGAPTPLPFPVAPSAVIEVSRDDRFVATRGVDTPLALYPLDGGTPVPLPELGDAEAVGWTAGGQLWVRVADGETRVRLLRFDIGRRKVLEERSFTPADTTGVTEIGMTRVTPDGRAIAFNYWRTVGNLYLLDRLVPARR